MRVKTALSIGALAMLAVWALGSPTLLWAQSPEPIATLSISVWPEFDDPRVLVQYDGELDAQDKYPREISFFVPQDASLHATAYADESQTLFNTNPPTITDAGNGFKRVTFQLPKRHFHLEYYQDALKGAPHKTFDFVYKAAQPTAEVRLEIQQPLKAENFATVPATAFQIEGMHGFKYYIFNYANVSAGQDLRVKVSYTKTDPKPSVQNVTSPQTAPLETAEVSERTDPNQLIWLGGLGIALGFGLLAVGYWFAHRSQSRSRGLARTTRHVSIRARDLATASDVDATSPRGERSPGGYCRQCGHPLRIGDNFCPKCGTQRK